MYGTVDQQTCIYQVVKTRAELAPHALAILAPGRPPLSYGRLLLHIDTIVQRLRTMGIGRHRRVALVLPNGPEMAVSFLAVAAGATCAPLNPAYRHTEMQHYLEALHVDVLITLTGMGSPAREVATTRGIPVVELSPTREGGAGLFTLSGEIQQHRGSVERASLPGDMGQSHDVALVLHTSGTTSQPRVVPLTHTHVCTSAAYTCEAVGLSERDRCLSIMPLFHAAGLVTTTLASMMAGGSVVCTPGFSASTFFAWMAEFRPTWYPAVPTMHRAILEQAAQHPETVANYPLRFIRSSTAPLPAAVLSELERVFQVPVIEGYGMTEACLITCNPLPPRPRKVGSVGTTAGPEVAIRNEAGAFLPAGVCGEIVIRGANVVQGYENDPLANRNAFSQGWLRTGDMGYFDADGYLFLSGRLNEIINRGGEKIAPQDVEQAILASPAVAEAVVFAVPHTRLGEDVAAVVTLNPNAVATADEIRQFVAVRLAAFKVPQQVLIVDDIPQGPTGKVQRRHFAAMFGLGASEPPPSERSKVSVTPRSPMEAQLVNLWAEVLGLQQLGIDDNFFALGGDSLLAMRLIARLGAVMNVEVPLQRFFQTPTVAAMATYLEHAPQAMSDMALSPVPPALRSEPFPLSYAQQRLWFLERLALSGHAYTLLEVVRLHGRLHMYALEQSLQHMVQRHAILRTTFAEVEGQPWQHIHPYVTVSCPVVDLQVLSLVEQEERTETLARQEMRRPFDLAEGPLLRAVLLRLTPETHVLLLTMHHIVFDGWSHRLFWLELSSLYRAWVAGEPPSMPPLATQYADFAQWQLGWMQGGVLDRLLTYWQRQLADMSTLMLPADYLRPAVRTSGGRRHRVAYSLSLTNRLKALSQQYGVTLFMTLFAVFQTLLHRYTDQEDIAIGTLVANRNRLETEALIGFFVNTVVLRTHLSGNLRFDELLEHVREVTLDALHHQDLPFEKLLEALRPVRELNRNPLFQVLFVLHNTSRQTPTLSDLDVSFQEIDPETAKFDLTLNLEASREGVKGWFEYSTDLFEAATITRMAGHFRTLLEGVLAAPEQSLSRLPLLTANERQQVLVAWNAPGTPYPRDQCLHHLFEHQVARTPDAVAVICGDTSLTYRELNRRANQVAHYLLALGVETEGFVGLCFDRSPDLVMSLLGILKAGAVYVPLDPAYPRERLAFMLADAQPAIVLTQEQFVPLVSHRGVQVISLEAHTSVMARCRSDNPVHRTTANSMAYLLYTSGSTGHPKGICGEHRATLNVLHWLWQTYPLIADDVSCHHISLSFTDATQELLTPLLQGVPTVLMPEAMTLDLPEFVQTLAAHRVSRLLLVPSLLRLLLDMYRDLQQRLPHLKLWFTGGEALSYDLYLDFQDVMPGSRLINLYGATETSANTTWYDTRTPPGRAASVPIGRPIANTQVYILDTHRQPVPIGVAGELYVGGDSLARGYHRQPELTAAHWLSDPFRDDPHARLYRTGDVVRYRSDGNIEYLGRFDRQVQLHGRRIELGEIEAALMQHGNVRQAAVVMCEKTPGAIRLIAYLVTVPGRAIAYRDLRRFLEKRLLAAWVPSAFVTLATLPLTPSGKVDRHVLSELRISNAGDEDDDIAPRTPGEETLAVIWRQLLDLDRVSIHDNFFELGGHSLLAMQLLFRVSEATQIRIPLMRFFTAPTISGMAAFIDAAKPVDTGAQMPPIGAALRDGVLPATILQEQCWFLDQALPAVPLFGLPIGRRLPHKGALNIAQKVRLRGPLNTMVLEQSVNEIINRHENLRTTFATVNEQVVQVIASALPIPLIVEDLLALPKSQREREAQRRMQQESQRPFNIEHGPLLRVHLWWLDELEHLLLITLHHMICDGFSIGILLRELVVLYEIFLSAEPSSLPRLSIQYADFAWWQRDWQHHVGMQAQLEYWRQQLHAPLPRLTFPTDDPKEVSWASYTARYPFELSGSLVVELEHLSRQTGYTLFTIYLAAFHVLLSSYTGQEDLLVATLVANRTCRETEALIGLLANTVLLRTNLRGNPTLGEVLDRVRMTTQAAYANQDLPFEVLVHVLERERGLQRASLCQVMVLWQNAPVPPNTLNKGKLRFEPMDQGIEMPNEELTTFDVIVMLRQQSDRLVGSVIYKTHLFQPETIERAIGDFESVLEILQDESQRIRTKLLDL